MLPAEQAPVSPTSAEFLSAEVMGGVAHHLSVKRTEYPLLPRCAPSAADAGRGASTETRSGRSTRLVARSVLPIRQAGN